jgi:hypothetical protein
MRLMYFMLVVIHISYASRWQIYWVLGAALAASTYSYLYSTSQYNFLLEICKYCYLIKRMLHNNLITVYFNPLTYGGGAIGPLLL